MKRLIVLIAALFLAPAGARAQALANRVPGDALLYVGWQGTDSLGPEYAGSHLKAIIDNSQFPQFVEQSLPRLVRKIERENPDVPADLVDIVTQTAGILSHHPTALYFGGLVVPPGGQEPTGIKLALLCDAGKDADALSQKLNGLLTQIPPGSPLQCQTFGSLVVLSGYPFAEHPNNPLSGNAQFTDALRQLDHNPIATVYVDMTDAIAFADGMIHTHGDPELKEQWPRIRDVIGIDSVRTVAFTAGFQGRNFSQQAWIDAPMPRKGLFASLGKPLSPDLVHAIPASAAIANAFSFDLSTLFNGIKQAVHQFSPENEDSFNQAIQMANQILGIDVQKDLIGSFGPQWGVFLDPDSAGTNLLSSTLINRPTNPQDLESSLTAVERFANAVLHQQLERNARITLAFHQETVGGVQMHYLASPLIAPTWAIKDGTLYVALFPQVVAADLQRPADGTSILDNPSFKTVMKNIGAPEQVASFSFIDVPRMLPFGYPPAMMVAQLYLGAGDLFDMNCPPLVFPTLKTLSEQAEPAGAAGWADDAGFHRKSVAPFPGAAGIASGNSSGLGNIYAMSAMTSIMLPGLNRARETANRVKCASNMRQVGQAILMYSDDNKGNYPTDLGTLIVTEDLTAATFLCPDSGKTVPANFDQLSPDAKKDWVNQNTDYIYLGKGLKMGADPAIVVLYERPENHKDGSNMLFADGHVEFNPTADMQRILKHSDEIRAAGQ